MRLSVVGRLFLRRLSGTCASWRLRLRRRRLLTSLFLRCLLLCLLLTRSFSLLLRRLLLSLLLRRLSGTCAYRRR